MSLSSVKNVKKRDDSVDVAKGIGILFVVGGHCGFEIVNFPSYSFHMPLFYFISGFFLHSYISNKNYSYRTFIIAKAKNLMLPVFIYNVVFGVFSYLIQFIGIQFNSGSFFSIVNIHNIFIEPFVTGHQYQISCPLWFVPSLFLVMILICISKIFISYLTSNKYSTAFLICICIALYYSCVHVTLQQNAYVGVLCRTVIGYVFCVLGYVYYINKDKLSTEVLLAIGILFYSCTSLITGEQKYSSVFNDYGQGVSKYISLPISLSGIIIVIAISDIICKYNKFLRKEDLAFLGKNSFHIMAVHLTGFLILNIIITMFSSYV